MTRQTEILLSVCACVLAPACGDNKTNSNSGPDAGMATDGPNDSGMRPTDAKIDAPEGSGSGSGMPALMPILDYSFEDVGSTVADSSGNAFDGTLTGDPGSIWTNGGRNGNGLWLQNPGANMATAEYVSLPSGVFTGVTDYTITFWVKLDQNLAWQRVYDFGNGLSGAANRFAYFTPLGFLPNPDVGLMADVFTAAGGSNQMTADDNIVNTQTQFPIGVWKHVAITTSAGVQTMYVDGFPVGTLTGDAVPASQLEPLAPQSWLGRSRFAPADPGLDGTLDDFYVFNKALTSDEIATQLALPQKDYTYWRFDEGTGTTAADLSDYKNTAALENGVTWDSDARLGGAVQLPGGAAGATGPTVELAKNPLADCTNQLTIAAWVKLDALTAWTQIFEVTSDVGVPGEEWLDLISYDGAAPHFAMITSTGDNLDLVAASNPFDNGSGQADGKWHHIAVTVAPDATDNTKNDVVMYGDGAVIGSVTTTAYVSAFSSTTTGAPMTHAWLGKSRFSDPYLAGSLDDLRVSCRAYTADEIKNLATPAK
ncbi:MAG TPA: LamG domain-containing protein [Kofleriaceae bacterium]|jgi:hypothetical protein